MNGIGVEDCGTALSLIRSTISGRLRSWVSDPRIPKARSGAPIEAAVRSVRTQIPRWSDRMYSQNASLTDEQQAALMRHFRLYIITSSVFLLFEVALCLFLLIAERVNVRAVSLVFGATLMARVFYPKWSGARASQITGRSFPPGIPIAVDLFVALLFLALVWFV
jgi:hypothetical protein